MFEIVLIVIMALSAGGVGYCTRAIHRPVQKRDKNGRYIKGK